MKAPTDDDIDVMYAELHELEQTGDQSRAELLKLKIEAAESARADEMSAHFQSTRSLDPKEARRVLDEVREAVAHIPPPEQPSVPFAGLPPTGYLHGIEIRVARELTQRLERERFAGGVNLSARERNAKRIKFYEVRAPRRMLVTCKHGWRLLQRELGAQVHQ